MSNDDFLAATQDVDLTNCDREPIHRLGHTQPFGCLVALRADWLIAFCSQNTQAYFGRDSERVIATPLKSWLDPQTLHDIRSAYQVSTITGNNERLFNRHIESSGLAVDISVHYNGTFIIVEFEQLAQDTAPEDSIVRSMLTQFKHTRNSRDLLQDTARQVQFVTGYDRVMIYQFLDDGAGEVVAEATQPDIEPFLGLRYPATDIPKQARTLYKKNLLRMIGDVHAEPVPVLPGVKADSEQLDLSFSSLRAVSPIHIQYLKNMGVGASMSISILVNGKLWGLIACHHYSARILSSTLRAELELFAEVFSLELSARLIREQDVENDRLRDVHDNIMASIGTTGSLLTLLAEQFETMRTLVQCDGIAAIVDGEYRGLGNYLPDTQLDQLLHYLNRQKSSEVCTLQSLAEVLSDYDTAAPQVAGVLAIPVSKSPRDYLLFYRSAQTQTVNWAGNPQKSVVSGPQGDTLLPRNSFAKWQQTHDDRCEAWQRKDLRSAESLRITLLEVIIRHFQEREEFQQKAYKKQEVLISELNHRVRNILNLVNAIVMQTDQQGRELDEFVNVLTGRLSALASAHDQLTASHWADVSFQTLLETEIQAYAYTSGVIQLDGPPVAIKPEATTPIVLVIHEMFTNAAKYGALSTSSGEGTVSLRWQVDAKRGLTIDWRESGGPPVTAPSREGFGMTLIQSVIPHELSGQMDIDFNDTGVTARMRVPARFLTLTETPPEPLVTGAEQETTAQLPESVLLVEDSLVIALDLQKKLQQLGIEQVAIAGNLPSAEQQLNEKRPDFLISDVHLGRETTFSLVARAVEAGIPSMIISGYGDELALPDTLSQVPMLTKPVGESVLLQTLHQLMAKASGAATRESL